MRSYRLGYVLGKNKGWIVNIVGDIIEEHITSGSSMVSQVTSAHVADVEKCLISDRDKYGGILANCRPIFICLVDLGMSGAT